MSENRRRSYGLASATHAEDARRSGIRPTLNGIHHNLTFPRRIRSIPAGRGPTIMVAVGEERDTAGYEK